mgnify:CR=1 FL=1
MKLILKLIFIATILISFISESFARTKYVSVGTGAITGVYYPAGGAICRLVNRGRKDHGIRCSVESTGGSVSNLNAVRSKTLDFAIVQSDWQYHSYYGTGFFADQKPFSNLRSVFSLYTETLAIAVRKSSNIKALNELKGKRVNYGLRGSGMYATMDMLMSIKGFVEKDFKEVTHLRPSEQPKALCDGEIDAMIYMSGNPNGVLQEAAQTCNIRILNISKKTVDKVIEQNSFYVKAQIPGGMYPRNPKNISTFGVRSALVTTKNTSGKIVYEIVKAVFDNFDNFKTLHPVFSSLNKKSMMRSGDIPLHEGSVKYFKERNLF